MSYRKAEKAYGVPKNQIHRRIKNPDTKSPGGQPVLDTTLEDHIASRLVTCSDWGFPLDALDLRYLVKGYLDKRGLVEPRFKQNMPGTEWVTTFMKRQEQTLSQRICQNIKRSRAAVTPEIVNDYFDNLTETLKDIPASNIVNYDETNLADDPGRKKIIIKRGSKYPERIMNHSKSATSLMYAAAADGTVLAPYIVYKATNIYDTWTMGGPKGARYNRSKSGWFDNCCFADWFMTIALPYLKKLDGPKVLIGDNLSSHLTLEVIEQCEAHNIRFVFFPANSTHLCQPLDVCFFRPMKMAWRPILEKWKKGPGRKQASVPKDIFPQLLRELTVKLEDSANENIISGFRKCGIVPIDRSKVLDRLPKPAPEVPKEAAEPLDTGTAELSSATTVDQCIMEMLQEMRHGTPEETTRKRKKKISVEPGKSVASSDLSQDEEDEESQEELPGPSNTTITEAGGSGGTQSDEAAESEEEDQDEENTMEFSSDEEDQDDSNASLRGVFPVMPSEIKPGMWVVVNFALNGRKLYLGKVEKMTGEREFEGKFLRPSQKSTGSSFVFPQKEDICIVNVHQVVGKTCTPEKMRRGILKFDVNSQKW